MLPQTGASYKIGPKKTWEVQCLTHKKVTGKCYYIGLNGCTSKVPQACRFAKQGLARLE